MARASVCLLVCASVILSNAVQDYKSDRFYFVKPPGYSRRAADECSACYGDECFEMNHARCELYTATTELLYGGQKKNYSISQPSNDDVKNQVDSLLMDFIQEASVPAVYKECFPLISQYTDCSKENACIGCKTCSCDVDGLWNCTIVHNCRDEDPVTEDHRTLVALMEMLTDDKKLPSRRRKRRWVIPLSSEEPASNHKKLKFEEISEWMYNVKPLNYENNFTEGVAETTEATKTDVTDINDDILNKGVTTPNYAEVKTDSDYLAFEDVLNYIGLQEKTYNIRRPLVLYNETVLDHDYMIFDNPNATFNHYNSLKAADHFVDIFNAIENQNSLEATTEVVIDLLEVARKKIGIPTPSSFNKSDSKEVVDDTKYKIQNDDSLNQFKNVSFEDNNDLVDFNIMKRDVSGVDNINKSTTTDTPMILTSTLNNNSTQTNHLLKTAMSLSLDKIIQSKEKELKGLMYVRSKIVEYLKENKIQSDNIAFNDSFELGNINNAYFSFFNIEINPENPETAADYRRSNNKPKGSHYLERLKRDILVVIRDVTALQRLIGFKNFSPRLKNLVRALRHYIHNTDEIYSNLKNKIAEGQGNLNTRRHWIYPYQSNKDLVKRYIVDILQIIDKDMPQTDALGPISHKSKEILSRIIKHYDYFYKPFNFTHTDDSQYSLGNSLENVGLKWNAILAQITMTNKPTDKLYQMKLLQFLVLLDITKINEAIIKLNFLRNRRLITIKDATSERQLKRINNDLRSIHSKINKILSFKVVTNNIPKKMELLRTPDKKQTLLKHIRNLLKNSKRDIIELLRKKVPKTEIVRELARKKLSDLSKSKMTKYRNVMKKWQENLNIVRKKRSTFKFEDIKNRIKNILPKYLRGKVHSGIRNSTKSKNKRTRPKNHSRRNKSNKRKTTTTVKSSTNVPKHNNTKS